MIGLEDAPTTYEFPDYYKILPAINLWDRDADMVKGGKLVNEDFVYTSDHNSSWMKVGELQDWISKNLLQDGTTAAPTVEA